MAIYGIATIFGNSAPGTEFSAEHLPLHLTHIDSFETEASLAELQLSLQKRLSSHKAFSLTAIQDVLYGPDRDIPVTELALTPQLEHLHTDIVAALESNGAVFKNPHYLRQYYRPHISMYGTRRINIGDTVLIRDVSVAAKIGTEDNDVRRILLTIDLQG